MGKIRRIFKHAWLICRLVLAALLLGTALLVADGLRERPGTADIGLVLGNKVEPDGTPSLRLRARLDRTLELYRAGSFPLVIASGGTGKEGFDEAVVMRDYLVAGGIPHHRVILDSAGNSTWLSAANTAAMMKQRKLGSVLVVSQYFHLPRSRPALQRQGVAAVSTGHPSYFEWRDLYSAPREFVGWISYWFRESKSN
jgi:vancomycin permeability regulator SanA